MRMTVEVERHSEPRRSTSLRAVGAGVDAVLRRHTSYWEVSYGAVRFRIKDLVGLSYLAELVCTPGRELHVLDLVAARNRGPSSSAEPALTRFGGGADDVLDPRARAEYRQRLDQLRDALDEARVFGNTDRVAAIRAEIDALTEALATAMGLGGRCRKMACEAEKARLNVTRAIRTAIRKLEEMSPEIGLDLTTGVSTGLYCSYDPDPRLPVRWSTVDHRTTRM